MAIVRKTLLTPGRFQSPTGPLTATPERIRSWADKFARLRDQGVEIPVPWSHFASAAPGEKHFLASRFNAGYVRDLTVGPGGALDVVLDCPGLEERDGKLVGVATLPDGSTVETAIKEVSAGIWDHWVDGRGQRHSDIIGHVALTTHPVVAGTGDFTGLATASATITYLSTSTPMDKLDELKDDVAAATEERDPTEEQDLDSILDVEPPAANTEQERLTRVLGLLAEGGIALPPDTSPENMLERLETALGVMIGQLREQKAAAAAEAAKEQALPPITEEPPPAPGAMLSTLIAPDNKSPLATFAKRFVASELERRRADRAKRLDALKSRGLPTAVADRLGTAKVFLSSFVDEAGNIRDDETDRAIALLEEAMPNADWAAIYLSAHRPDVQTVGNPISGDGTSSHPGGLVPLGNLLVTPEEAKSIREWAGV